MTIGRFMKLNCRTVFILIISAITVFQVKGQGLTETDHAVARFRQYYNSKNYDSIFYMMSPRIQGLMKLDKTKEVMSQLYGQMGELQSVKYDRQEDKLTYYNATFQNTALELIASLDKEGRLDAFRFIPTKEQQAKAAEKQKEKMAGATDIVLETANGGIFGTLTMPVSDLKVPVVLLLAGSGPTDRDGNNTMGVSCDTYLMLADSLRKAGIACVRYDKRGIGQSKASMRDEASVTFDTMVSDAVGYIKMLRADSRFSDVIVMGHSEGSLIGMIAAQKGAVNKFISIAGVAEPADKIIKAQLKAQSDELMSAAGAIMDSLKKGYDVKNIPASLTSLFRPSVMPYLRSWLRYDPQKEIKKLKTLIGKHIKKK